VGLRFRPSPDAVAWRRGAAGERRTARLLDPLERHGWIVLHDLAVPGSRANIDHLVIGPGGVFVVDSKQYRSRLQLDPSGRLWHGRYPLAPILHAVSFEADQAAQVLPDPHVVVLPIVAVHGAQVPWSKVVTHGVPVVSARCLPSMFRQLPAVLGPERVAHLADQAWTYMPPSLDPSLSGRPLPRGNHPVWAMPSAGFRCLMERPVPLERCRAAGVLQPAVGHR
jgi:Nuclease-related domain